MNRKENLLSKTVVDSGWIGDDNMTKISYTKESARKLWTEARDKYQMQLDFKNRKGIFSHEIHMTALEDRWLRHQIRYCNDRIEELEV